MAYGTYLNGPMMQPNAYGYNGGYQPQAPMMQQSLGKIQPVEQYVPAQPTTYKPAGLQGKVVDSIDVVKASEIPYDYSVSYFPLTDNSAIITKQLMPDGTSKTTVYKPVEEPETAAETPKYVTQDELNKALEGIDIGKEYKDDIKGIKRDIKNIFDDIKELSDNIKE